MIPNRISCAALLVALSAGTALAAGDKMPLAAHRAAGDRGEALRISSPLTGSTLILDPDLPAGGQRLPLRASAPLADPEWSSASLAIERDGPSAVARLVPGRHEIRLHDPVSGETTSATITVRSL